MENPRELCTFSLLLTQWNSGCSLPEAGASQMSHRFPQPTLPPSFLASCYTPQTRTLEVVVTSKLAARQPVPTETAMRGSRSLVWLSSLWLWRRAA